jgi:hypothetical protein
MNYWSGPVGCACLCLTLSSVAAKPETTGESALDGYHREVAERAAWDALFRSEPMLVVGLSKGPASSSASAASYVDVCQSWAMAPGDFVQFFKLGNAIGGEERHYSYSVYPCEYRGTLQVSDRVFEFQLNLASWAALHDTVSDAWYTFGCREPCRPLFPPTAQWFDHHQE